MNHLNSLLKTAKNAFYWTSFNPEQRGARLVESCDQELTQDLAELRRAAEQEGRTEDFPAISERYIRKYTELLRIWLGSESNCASSAVTGPARFPVAKMEKRRRWADNHNQRFRQWREKAKTAILKGLKPKITPATELEAARKKLLEREAKQELMKTANAIIRRYKNAAQRPAELETELRAAGVSEAGISYIFNARENPRTRFETWELSNNNAEIRRLRERIADMEFKAAKAAEPQEKLYNGFKVVWNYEIDRVQIVFDEKPNADILRLLKKRGYNYSPTNRAHQRKLTGNGMFTTKQLVPEIQKMLAA